MQIPAKRSRTRQYVTGTMVVALAFWQAAWAQAQENPDLGADVLMRAADIGAQINAAGGYRFDGVNDCYGFVRRVWNPVLARRASPPLPVSDFVSKNWNPIQSWSGLVPGDVLATHQGHRWGANWHTGLFFGIISDKAYILDNSSVNSPSAKVRTAPAGLFHYYYRPTHEMLGGSGSDQASGSYQPSAASNRTPRVVESPEDRQAAILVQDLSGADPEIVTSTDQEPSPLVQEPPEADTETAPAGLFKFVKNLFK